MAKELFSEKTEKALLGLLITKPNLIKNVIGSIEPGDFYFKDNELIFQALLNSFSKLNAVDDVLLLEELSIISSKQKSEWMDYFSVLILEKGLDLNIEKYTLLIKEKQQARLLKETLQDSVQLVGSDGNSISDLIGKIESKIFNVTKNRKLKDFSDINTLTKEFQLKMKKMSEVGYQDGIRTRISTLDNKIGGLKDGEFIIIAARPSMGKTAFSLEIAKNVARTHNVGLFSLEMPSEQLIKRMISSESMLGQEMFKELNSMSQITSARMSSSIETIKKLNLWIDDSATLKIGELTWKVRKLNDLHNLDLVIIDYLQLIDSTDRQAENRQQAISEISRQLKALAREINIPVIALSQLSRRVEQREDKRPQMSDIRESGAIEQDADIIMFLYREDYYNHREEESDIRAISDLEVIVSKHRNGPTGIVRLGLDLRYGKISTMYTTFKKG